MRLSVIHRGVAFLRDPIAHRDRAGADGGLCRVDRGAAQGGSTAMALFRHFRADDPAPGIVALQQPQHERQLLHRDPAHRAWRFVTNSADEALSSRTLDWRRIRRSLEHPRRKLPDPTDPCRVLRGGFVATARRTYTQGALYFLAQTHGRACWNALRACRCSLFRELRHLPQLCEVGYEFAGI